MGGFEYLVRAKGRVPKKSNRLITHFFRFLMTICTI